LTPHYLLLRVAAKTESQLFVEIKVLARIRQKGRIYNYGIAFQGIVVVAVALRVTAVLANNCVRL
jgi:hypothetical protein